MSLIVTSEELRIATALPARLKEAMGGGADLNGTGSLMILPVTDPASIAAASTPTTDAGGQLHLLALMQAMKVGAPWHEVGATGEPAFVHSGNLGSTYATVGFRCDALGVVRFKGSAAAFDSGWIVFNLPTGFRPLADRIFPISTSNGHGSIVVYLNGDVMFAGTNASDIYLDGLSFEVF